MGGINELLFNRGRKKIKLKATWSRNPNGSITATIKVVDRGDFPTVNIFGSTSEEPASVAWNLGKGTISAITKTLSTPEEAKQWVSVQIGAIKWKLEHWRSNQVLQAPTPLFLNFRFSKKMKKWLLLSVLMAIIVLPGAYVYKMQSFVNQKPKVEQKVTGKEQLILLDDCEQASNINMWGGLWFSFDDRQHGGSSEVIPTPGSVFQMSPGGAHFKYCTRIVGKVTTKYKWGYIGMGTDLKHSGAPLDLSRFKGIQFYVKGDDKMYRFMIHSQATKDFDDFGYNFRAPESWTKIKILFKDMTQQGWGEPAKWDKSQGEASIYAVKKALCIVWETLGQPQDRVELAVDNIALIEK
ncbi:MAG: hypothetical protein AMJ45_05740 [Syntrophobacter sp. DG_60]|nr:MAG: hypothetical protein AMJ45_05740 [Syntrophobacter sp. DG_60]